MKYSAVKGVNDILPPEIYAWQKAESAAREIFGSYGFQELRIPIIEHTDIFTRSIGETSDIVEKEMYTFPDKAGRSITLRPEGTAPAVRCYIENNLHTLPSPQKFYYTGPMFRYERPQKGRLRQFYQIGVEAFGSAGPSIDAEVITMLYDFLQRVGMDGLNIELNSMGCENCRPRYREALIGFFSDKLESLCPDCKRRFLQNPLRILDCKVPSCIEQKKGAPPVSDHLCGDCTSHLDALRHLLDLVAVPYTVNPSLVRGLDYYTRTIFEVKSTGLGAQNAVSAGGRYDNLVEEFGGQKTPAIGFAVGMERLISLMGAQPEPKLPVFIAALGENASGEALKVARSLRKEGIRVEVGGEGASLKSQMRKADRLGAAFALILGEDEIKEGAASWKDLRSGESGKAVIGEVYKLLKGRL